jgi:hypothetical protein
MATASRLWSALVRAATRRSSSCPGTGSALDAIHGDAAVVISIALQHGIPATAPRKSVGRVPETLDGPAVRAASPIAAALDLVAEYERGKE